LGDGRLLWKVDRQPSDQYVAGVFGDKVVIVGSSQIRALSLADGQVLWQRGTGMPSGQGVAAGKVYYLPLRATQQGSPGIVGIDVEGGREFFFAAPPETPGTWVLPGRDIVSQPPTAVTMFTAK